MHTTRETASVMDQLAREPHRFEFFQAVRLLERFGMPPRSAASCRQPVGQDYLPREEVVRFCAAPTHAFPPSDIGALTPSAPQPEGNPRPPSMVVSFLGMIGHCGVLPRHYTQLVIDRLRQKDKALRDFLDLFCHRVVSFFYRAWCKYRFIVGYERARSVPEGREEDLVTWALFCLVGMGTQGLRARQDVADETLLYYAGHFAHYPRSAAALEGILADYFGLPARVLQFCGQWLYLSPGDQSRLGRADGMNNRLGENVVVGARVWGVESKFRVRLGPLTYAQFHRFSPRGDLLKAHCQLVRTYAGPELDFDVQPVLRAAEVPPCRLGGDARDASRLGWNTWIHSLPLPRDAEDAVFGDEGWPNR